MGGPFSSRGLRAVKAAAQGIYSQLSPRSVGPRVLKKNAPTCANDKQKPGPRAYCVCVGLAANAMTATCYNQVLERYECPVTTPCLNTFFHVCLLYLQEPSTVFVFARVPRAAELKTSQHASPGMSDARVKVKDEEPLCRYRRSLNN